MSDRLSSELLFHADEIEREMLEERTPEERRDYIKHQLLVEGIVKVLISTRETITSTDLSVFEVFVTGNRELAADLLDSHYALLALKETDNVVTRTLQLAQLRASNTPSDQTNRYIREAARTYISGFPMASVAMSRAALEQGLKDRLGRQGDGLHVTFKDLVDEAVKCNILGRTGSTAARILAKECNTLLHEKPVQDDAHAFKVLAEIRSLLEEVFSAVGGY